VDTSFERTIDVAAPQPPDVRNDPTPLAALGARSISTAAHFRREHFPVPDVDRAAWRLRIGGSVATPAIVTLADLVGMPRRSLVVVLECAGHRRAELLPVTPGLQWQEGAVAEARWTGTPLRGLLRAAGIDPGAAEVVLTGTDRGSFERLGRYPYARSLPLAKALHKDTILAFEMNGEPIPPEHGGPVRAIVPGWYATDSVKWLERVHVAQAEFDGPFQALDYRFAAADDPAAARAAFADTVRETIDPFIAASWAMVDDIIDPADTRRVIIEALEGAETKRQRRAWRKHGVPPV